MEEVDVFIISRHSRVELQSFSLSILKHGAVNLQHGDLQSLIHLVQGLQSMHA